MAGSAGLQALLWFLRGGRSGSLDHLSEIDL
jgi:hypothetical protein